MICSRKHAHETTISPSRILHATEMLSAIRRLSFAILVPAILFLSSCASHQSVEPYYREDLRPYGLQIERGSRQIVSYNRIAFITDNALLVAINQRDFERSGARSEVDEPPAKLLLFDVGKRSILRSTEMRIEKDADAVQPLSGGRFVIRNESGILICDSTFICHPPISMEHGPLVSSPAGSSFVAGGYGNTEQILLDSTSLNELGRFPSPNPAVVPGDGASLLRYLRTGQLFLKETGKGQRELPFRETSGILLPDSRFLNDTVIGVNESEEVLLVARSDGTPLYRVPVHPWYRGTSIIASASGSRFGIYESDFTQWNSATHFYDIENTRPHNIERIRVLEINTGRMVFQLERDPRPYINHLTLPALAPDGHHLATIYHGFLEIYGIP